MSINGLSTVLELFSGTALKDQSVRISFKWCGKSKNNFNAFNQGLNERKILITKINL